MNPSKSASEFNPEEGLFLFTQGKLVVAREMVHQLDEAGFYIQEHELLDPNSWPRQSGLPAARVDGVPGLFFCPGEVIPFMNAWVDAADEENAGGIPRASGGDSA